MTTKRFIAEPRPWHCSDGCGCGCAFATPAPLSVTSSAESGLRTQSLRCRQVSRARGFLFDSSAHSSGTAAWTFCSATLLGKRPPACKADILLLLRVQAPAWKTRRARGQLVGGRSGDRSDRSCMWGAAVESKRQGAKEAELGEAEARRVAPPPASETIIFAVRLTATRAMNQLESKPL